MRSWENLKELASGGVGKSWNATPKSLVAIVSHLPLTEAVDGPFTRLVLNIGQDEEI